MQTSLWVDRNEYPFAAQFLPIKGCRMHYVDEGSGHPILMVHGTSTWSFLFRDLIKALSPNYRCIAMDHIGFGLSDHPQNFSYKPEAHAENLQHLIRHLGLTDFSMMVHDFGGPIGLSYAIQHPQHVRNLILFNTWMWSVKGDPSAERTNKLIQQPLGKLLYEQMNFSARVLLPRAVVDRSKLPPQILAQYVHALPDRKSRKGTIVFAQELIDSGDWFDKLWRQREAIKEIPALILWGMQDRSIKLDSLERWLGLFTNNHLIRYQKAGHLVPEECRELIAPLIAQFLAGHEFEYIPSEKDIDFTDSAEKRRLPLDLDK